MMKNFRLVVLSSVLALTASPLFAGGDPGGGDPPPPPGGGGTQVVHSIVVNALLAYLGV
jgi:hypothetical protein